MQITKYIPQPNYKTKIKTAVVLIALGSLFLNYRLLKANYVVSCGVNMQVVARFISKEKCDQLYTNWMDSTELARMQFLIEEAQAEESADLYQ